MMKIKVTANGQPDGTRITADGADLSDNITEVRFSHSAGQIPMTELLVGFIEYEVESEVRCVASNGKDIARIVYADGSVDVYPTQARAHADLGRLSEALHRINDIQ